MEKTKRLGKKQRHRQIVDELRIKPAVRAMEIARRLGVHVETVRRDMNELHLDGQISRTYGGAAPVSVGVEASLDERDRLLIVERTRMADLAASLINVGDVVMVDVGSTTSHFARSLSGRAHKTRIITNNWKLIASIDSRSQIDMVLCPGEYSHEQGGVAGSDTVEFLKRFHADKVVLSVGGVTEDGLYEFDPSFAWIKRIMIGCSQERILIVDHSKFGRKVMDRVCGLDLIDRIVVDRHPEGRLLEKIESADVQLHVAGG